MKIECGENYPDERPTLQFISKINMNCVNPKNGMVEASKLGCLKNWTREYTMETILSDLRK